MPLYEEVLTIPTFIKGINQSLDEQLIEHDEAYYASNVDVSDGVLSRAKGSTLHTSATLSNAKKLMTHYSTGTSVILSSTDANIYKLESDVYTPIHAIITSITDYINYQQNDTPITIMLNGVSEPMIYDGTNVSLMDKVIQSITDTDSSPDNDLNLTIPNPIPIGKYIELHKERVWISGDNDSPNRLYFSKDFDPYDWSTPTNEEDANKHGGFIDIPTWDGGRIIGIKNLYDDLMVFKNNNVFRIFGTYPGNYEVSQVFASTKGGVVENSIASVENKVFWVTDEGIYIFNGVSTSPIHYKVKEYFNRINTSYLDKIQGICHKGKYILSLPIDSSVINNLVLEYTIDTDTWIAREGLYAESFIVVNDELLFLYLGMVLKYNESDNYIASNIDSYWESGTLTFGMQHAKKNILKVYFIASGNGDVKFTCETERKVASTTVTLTSEEQLYKIRLRNKGRKIKFKIENVDGSDFTIKPVQILYDMDID